MSTENAVVLPKEETLDQTLNRSDFGHWITLHRQTFLMILGGVVAACLLYAVWVKYQESKLTKDLNLFYNFQQKELEAFKKGEKTAEQLVASYAVLVKNNASSKAFFTIAPKVIQELMSKKNFKEATLALEMTYNTIDKKGPAHYLLGYQLSTAYEDQGQSAKAVEILERLSKDEYKFLESRVAFDLGRLYAQMGKNEEATKKFDEFLTKFGQDDLAPLAQLLKARAARN